MTHVYFVRHAEPNYENHDDSSRELSSKGLADRVLVTGLIVAGLDEEQQLKLVQYALRYAPYVRALLGAIMENTGASEIITEPLRQSLNGISKYRLPISEDTLPNKINWRIYAPSR